MFFKTYYWILNNIYTHLNGKKYMKHKTQKMFLFCLIETKQNHNYSKDIMSLINYKC